MITVDEALAHLFSLVSPLDSEVVPLREAHGRVLARSAEARRDQPPFAASSMDGYALRNAEATPGAAFDVVGESAAGHGFDGTVGAGQAVRIFTGAPLPEGADRVIIQEDVTRDGDRIILSQTLEEKHFVRPKGDDFRIGDIVAAPRLLSPEDIALLASMNLANLEVTRKPKVALIATGDELVMPGEDPGPDQIIASNSFGLAALLDTLGAEARMLPIAGDDRGALECAFDLAQGADLVVTIGGASVGDHDLVGDVAAGLGMERSFYKVAMRPGKPLMAGRMGTATMLGLPGNPVSAMVCGHIFMAPMIRVMLGLGAAPAPRLSAKLAAGMDKGGPREHYMRAQVEDGQILPERSQDSGMLSILARANALLVRPAGDAPRQQGDWVDYVPI